MLKMAQGVEEICIESETLTVRFALNPAEVEQALKLRYHVFTNEMGAKLPDCGKQIDQDEFDPYCFHLIAIDKPSQQVVGTYRILTPENARIIGKYYSESEFELSGFGEHRTEILEFGRSCTHPEYRNGVVIMNMLAALTRFIYVNRYIYVFGCASVSLKNNGQDVVAVTKFLEEEQPKRANQIITQPITRYPHTIDLQQDGGTLPPLIKAYIRIGSTITGEPAWDPVFDVLDYPVLLNSLEMNPRYLERFAKTMNLASMQSPL